MCENTKQKDEKAENEEKDNWSHDQKTRNYYYDDSHGYKIYDPDLEDNEEEDMSD